MFRRSLALTRFARIGATALGLGVAFLFGRASAVDPALRPTGASIDDILKKNPPAEGEAFRVLPVASGRDSSVSVVRARKALRPHYHEGREETVYVVRGGGTMRLGDKERPIRAGDLVHIPRGVVHGFVNGRRGDTVVVSVMSPPFDGIDRHFLDSPSP